MEVNNKAYLKKCNGGKCESLANFEFSFYASKKSDMYLCLACARKLYENLAKEFVPKSPKNIFKNKEKI